MKKIKNAIYVLTIFLLGFAMIAPGCPPSASEKQKEVVPTEEGVPPEPSVLTPQAQEVYKADFVFISDRNGFDNLYSASFLHTDSVKNLTRIDKIYNDSNGRPFKTFYKEPSFSPDGRLIAINWKDVSQDPESPWSEYTSLVILYGPDTFDIGYEGLPGLVLMAWTGSINEYNYDYSTGVSWNPDSKMTYFIAKDLSHGGYGIFTAEATYAATNAVVYQASAEAVLEKVIRVPTSEFLIFSMRPIIRIEGRPTYDLWLLDLSAGPQNVVPIKKITLDNDDALYDDIQPASNDGKTLYWVRVSKEGKKQIMTCDLDLTNSKCADDPSGVSSAKKFIDDNAHDYVNPSVCPDGSVLFTTNKDGNHEIYRANAKGEALQNLTNNPANDFDPYCNPQYKPQ